MGIESISLLHSCVNLHLFVKPKYEKVQGRHGLLSHFVTCGGVESMQFFIVAFVSWCCGRLSSLRGEVAAVFPARVNGRGFIALDTARMLPRLPRLVPMEAKLR
jgi:hypothetical protein